MNPEGSSTAPTFKAPAPIQANQNLLDANSLAASILSPSPDSMSGEASRKKSGFVITRIDKASISSALENESDMENEFFNDRCGAGYRSPGSSSVISESSSIFEDAASPEKSCVPRISLQGPTPIISPCPTRPSAFLPASGLKQSNASVQDQETIVGVGILLPLTTIQSPAATSSKDTSASSASSSRFHIIKIDSGPYKRGRWNCRDFDESCSPAVRSDMIAVGGPRSGSSNGSSGGKTSYYIVDENGRQAAVEGQVPLLLATAAAVIGNANDEQTDRRSLTPVDADAQNTQTKSPLSCDVLLDSSVQPQATFTNCNQTLNLSPNNTAQQSLLSPSLNGPSARQVPLSSTNKFAAPSGIDLNNATVALLDSIIGGGMQQQGGQLLTSSSTRGGHSEAALIVGNLQSAGDVAISAMMQSDEPAAAGVPSVAIDNKIEQAMDLVKTHLLYAVREEVEVLKEKIVDLEKKVFRLETENKLLREYAPPEILQQIQTQNGTLSYTNSPMTVQQLPSTSPSPCQIEGVSNSSAVLVSVLAPVPVYPQSMVIPELHGVSPGAISNAISPSQQQPPS